MLSGNYGQWIHNGNQTLQSISFSSCMTPSRVAFSLYCFHLRHVLHQLGPAFASGVRSLGWGTVEWGTVRRGTLALGRLWKWLLKLTPW